jgi:hypothetical protein
LINYLDLFSGIGGFALGAYWAGMKFDNHYFSEATNLPEGRVIARLTAADSGVMARPFW